MLFYNYLFHIINVANIPDRFTESKRRELTRSRPSPYQMNNAHFFEGVYLTFCDLAIML